MSSFITATLCSAGVLIANKLMNGRIVSTMDKLLAYIITNYRPLFAFFVLLPLSFITNFFFYLKTKYEMQKTMGNNEEASLLHQQKILKIQNQIKYWNDNFRDKQNSSKYQYLCTARAGWKTMSLRIGKYKSDNKYYQINLNELNSIVEIDLENEYVLLEPNVTMGQLSSLLLPLGYSIGVLPELDDLTIGGLICGMGIESTSHIHGLFQYIVLSYEIILNNGQIVECNANSKDLKLLKLFYCFPMSYGTLGMLLSCKIKIIKIKSYVALEYIPAYSKKDAINIFTNESLNGKYDIIEGLAYGHDRYVIMRGKFAELPKNSEHNKENVVVNPIGLWYKPWFYKHVETFLNKKQNNNNDNGDTATIYLEYIPLRDYYHRHTRSLFWEVEDILTFGNNIIFRYLFGWLMPLNVSLLKRTQTKELQKLYTMHHVVQDMLIPINKLDESLTVIENEFNVYPLWMCPMKIFTNNKNIESFVYPNIDKNNLDKHEKNEINERLNDGYDYSSMYVDIGIYGNPKNQSFEAKKCLRNVEKFVRDVDGYQMLYADTYMTRDEFRQMYHHDEYDKLRKELNCDGVFPEVFGKVCKEARE